MNAVLLQWGELFQGFYTQKIIYSVYVADKIRLGTVFVQHRKKCISLAETYTTDSYFSSRIFVLNLLSVL